MMFEGSSGRLLAGVVYAALLVAASWSDLRTRRIPNLLVAVLAAGGFVFGMTSQSLLSGALKAAGGLMTAFLLWIALYAIGVLGAGDVKLAAAAGSWLGARGSVEASLLAAMTGGVLALLLLVSQRSAGPAMQSLAIWLGGAVQGRVEPLLRSAGASDRRQLPYGIAIAIGFLIAAWSPGLIF
jgi:prepilin peptidase CpaA